MGDDADSGNEDAPPSDLDAAGRWTGKGTLNGAPGLRLVMNLTQDESSIDGDLVLPQFERRASVTGTVSTSGLDFSIVGIDPSCASADVTGRLDDDTMTLTWAV